MKKIFLFIFLFLLPSCFLTKPVKRNNIDEGIFLGYKENSSIKMCLEITHLSSLDEYDEAKGLNVIEDQCVYSYYKISFYEFLENDSGKKFYNFYNLKLSEQCEKDDYYWYIDDNKTTFKPITSLPNKPLGLESYYLIDYFDNNGELDFSAKLYTKEKFDSLYKTN